MQQKWFICLLSPAFIETLASLGGLFTLGQVSAGSVCADVAARDVFVSQTEVLGGVAPQLGVAGGGAGVLVVTLGVAAVLPAARLRLLVTGAGVRIVASIT